jgi:integrase/recombinase XerC
MSHEPPPSSARSRTDAGLLVVVQDELPFSRPAGSASLAGLGRLVRHCWLRRAALDVPVLTPEEVLRTAALGAATALDEEIGLIASQLAALDGLTDASARRMTTEIARFVVSLETDGVASLRDVTQHHAQRFVQECVKNFGRYTDPQPATQHLRRSAIRMLFGTARSLHLVAHDPTLDLVLPSRSTGHVRPLDDDEEFACRVASRQTLTATRLPSAWALGQATATASEIGNAEIRHLDLSGQRIWLSGNSRRVPRWGQLTDWGVKQLTVRIGELDGRPDARLVYNGVRGAVAAGKGWTAALHEVLNLAGLAHEPDIKPASLPAWAGRRAFEATGRIEDAARTLGIRSLDRTAEVIGWDWS